MICAATLNPSKTKDTERPIPIPNAASDSTQPVSSPPEISGDGWGQYGNSATAMLSASTIRAWSARDPMPGIGTKMNTPPIRATVRRNPSKVEVERTISPCIPAQIPQDENRVRRDFGEHPWHREKEGPQERDQARNRAEAGVLDRGDDLDQADDDAGHEADHQQRGAQPERRHQALPQNLDYEFGRHA